MVLRRFIVFSVLLLNLGFSTAWSNTKNTECQKDADCVLVSNPNCSGEFNVVSVNKKDSNSSPPRDCDKSFYTYSNTDKDKSLKATCVNKSCQLSWTTQLTEKEMLNKIDSARSCESKADCQGPLRHCPFGCGIYVNKNSFQMVKDLLDHRKETCEYKCNNINNFDCIKNLCTPILAPATSF